MSRRSDKASRRFMLTTPSNDKPRPCSRCGLVMYTSKDARAHFREEHTFACMMETENGYA